MNIPSTTSAGILDVQNRNRDDQRKQGTSIQKLLPITGPGGPLNDQTQPATNDATSVFDSLISTAIDTLNPLQHIPGVSTAYQAATEDTMNPIASMAGGFLFGGPVGLIAGAANSFIKLVTGKGIGEQAMAILSGDQGPSQAQQASQSISQIGDGKPMVQKAQGLSVDNYKAFARTTHEQNLGIGAEANSVAWASNTLITQTLRQVTGAYEANQSQGAKSNVSRFS